MPLGKYFRLTKATLCIETLHASRRILSVPEDEVVKVLSGPRPDDQRMIEVLWRGRRLVLFAEDLQARGEEVEEKFARA
jgi:hypothetical protein